MASNFINIKKSPCKITMTNLLFIFSIMMHVYFSLRPEKSHYLRSIFKGWLTRKEYNENHDPDRWDV